MYKKVTQWVERNSEGEQSLDPTRCFKKNFRPIVHKIATAKWEKHDDGRVKLHTFLTLFRS